MRLCDSVAGAEEEVIPMQSSLFRLHAAGNPPLESRARWAGALWISAAFAVVLLTESTPARAQNFTGQPQNPPCGCKGHEFNYCCPGDPKGKPVGSGGAKCTDTKSHNCGRSFNGDCKIPWVIQFVANEVMKQSVPPGPDRTQIENAAWDQMVRSGNNDQILNTGKSVGGARECLRKNVMGSAQVSQWVGNIVARYQPPPQAPAPASAAAPASAPAPAAPGIQDAWRWCNKCRGLTHDDGGTCAAGGQHDTSASGGYFLDYGGSPDGQANWFWCSKCKSLVHGQKSGRCPATGGVHDTDGSGEYWLRYDKGSLDGTQNDWRWCSNCMMLHHSDGKEIGSCPKGGKHLVEGYNYNVRTTGGAISAAAATASQGGPGGGADPKVIAYVRAQLDQFRDCIVDRYLKSKTKNLPPRDLRDGARSMDGQVYSLAQRTQFLCQLEEAAGKGDQGTFTKIFPQAVLADCIQCEHGRHTKHVHCTDEAGGNNGFIEGPRFKTCQARVDIGNWAQQAIRDAGKWFQQAGQVLEKAGKVILESLCGPPCVIEKITRVMSDENARKQWASDLEEKMKAMADSFKGMFFDITNAREIPAKAASFASTTFTNLQGIILQIQDMFLPKAFGMEVLIGNAIAAGLTGAITLPVMGLATIHFGVKELIKWLIPELLFATGNIYADIENKRMDPLVQGFFGFMKAIAGPIVGIIGNVLKPEKKAKLAAAIEKALNIAQKIRDATTRGLEAARAAGGAAAVQTAMNSALPDDFLQDKKNIPAIIGALSEFATEEIWAALQKPFEKLMGAVITALNKVIDIPRNALVGAVGSIPFVGGILSGALNLGLGFIVDKIDQGISDFLMSFVEEMVKKSLKEIFEDLKRKLTDPNAPPSRLRGFQGFLNFVNAATQHVTTQLKAAKAALQNSLAGNIAGLAGTAASAGIKAAIQGMSLPADIKEMLSLVLDRVPETASTMAATPIQAKNIVRSLANIGAPIGELLIRKIPAEPAVTRLLTRAHAGLMGALDDIGAVKDDPLKALSGFAAIVGDFLKEKLGEALKGDSLGAERDLVGRAIDSLVALLANRDARTRLLTPPAATTVLGKVADLAKPYFLTRLTHLVEGTGLEKLVELAVNGFFGNEGPLRKGTAFFTGLPGLLSRDGQRIAGDVLIALADFLGRQVERAAGGRVSGALVRGLVEAVGNKLKTARNLSELANGGADGILQMAKDAFGPLLSSIVPGTALAGQAAPTTALLQTLGTAVLGVMQNPGRLKTEPGKVIAELAGALAGGLKDLVTGAVLALDMDAGLRPFVKTVLEGIFDLLSDPTEIPKFRGKQAVLALQKGASSLLPYLKQKTLGALPGPAQELVGALFDDLLDAVKSPESVEQLISGRAKDYIARAARVLGPPLVKLLLAALPAPVRTTVQSIAEKILAKLKDPATMAALAAQTVTDLVRSFGAETKALVKALLATVAGASPADIDTALEKIAAAAVNPSSAGQAAGNEAVKAIDEKLLPLVARIDAALPRELALGLVGVLRELVSASGGGGLRANGSALLKRLTELGARFARGLATEALPPGEIREVVFALMRGAENVFGNPQGLRAGLEVEAKTFLLDIAARVTGFVQEAIRARVPDPTVATLLSGLLQKGLELLAKPSEWSALAQEGIGAVLKTFVPIGERFVVGAIAQVGRLGGDLRSFLESFVHAVSELVSKTPLRSELLASPATALVRAGLRGLKGFLKELLDRATGSEALVRAFDGVAEKGIALLLDGQARSRFFAMNAQAAFAAASDDAVTLINAAVASALKNQPDLLNLAKSWLTSTQGFVKGLLASPRDPVPALRGALGKDLVPAIASFVKSKVQKVLGGARVDPGVVGILTSAYDELTAFGASMITDTSAAQVQARLAAKKLLLPVLNQLVSLASKPIERAIPAGPVRSFVIGLLESVRDVLADPEELVAAFRAGPAAPARILQLFLPKLVGVLEPLVNAELVGHALANAGIFKNLVKITMDEIFDVLRTPPKLLALVDDIKNAPRTWRTGLLPKVRDFVLKLVEAFKPPALQDAVYQGMRAVVTGAFGMLGR
jgi:hypothetical protein